MVQLLFFALLIISAFLQPAYALFLGIIFVFIFKNPYPKYCKKASKYLLQVCVVGLGFGMNIHRSLAVGKEGIVFTIISVTAVLVIGWVIGKWFKLPTKLSYLISSGTAICGGSAIAAVAPIVRADDDEISLSLATIFILNAIALFIFPPIGHSIGLSENQFGMWAAIAIHDTSSVVGAAASYGKEALEVATTVKLTRALWIIPLSLVSILLFRSDGKRKISIPWFIFLFILAMVINTYLSEPVAIKGWETVREWIVRFSHILLSVVLFLIGTGLSISAIKNVGFKPIGLGVTLWILISVVSLLVILY